MMAPNNTFKESMKENLKEDTFHFRFRLQASLLKAFLEIYPHSHIFPFLLATRFTVYLYPNLASSSETTVSKSRRLEF